MNFCRNPTDRTAGGARVNRNGLSGFSGHAVAGLVVLLTFGLAAVGSAQPVLAPPPLDFSGKPPAFQTIGTNIPGVLPPITVPGPPTEPLWQWGSFQVRPHPFYRFLYGDGVPAAPGDHVTTAINELYPGVLLMLGSHWTLDYTPTLRFYSNKTFRDTFDNSVILNGGTTYEDWVLGFSQSYVSSSEPLAATGGQTDVATYSTGLSGTCPLSTALKLELGLNQTFNYYGENGGGLALSDWLGWSTMDWLSYQYSPTLNAAVGLGLGYDYLSPGSDMAYERLEGRFIWVPGSKLSVSVSGGFEVRQFLNSGLPDGVYPLFGLSALYHVFEPTTISLATSLTVAPSPIENALTETLTVTGALRQRLLNHLFLDVTGGYFTTSYSSTTAGATLNREDSGPFVTVRLSLPFLTRGTAAVFYTHTADTSNQAAFTFSSDQVGAEVGYHF